jgi:mannose-6-phosphate isomerase
MERLYPLRFQALYKHAVWGGRRLETVLGKPLGDGNDFAESWEVADHGADQSIVANGPLAGTSLGQLVRRQGAELLGRHHPQPRFPLLLKYLDAHQRLSVQVHPDDALAARMQLSDPGKTEAWVILAAEPTSLIWAGLKEPVDCDVLRRAIERGDLEPYLHQFRPVAGQCIFLPARTVHALGDGLLVAEIQQNSDLTFRLFDWNRVGPDGRSRPLHIEEGLEAIDCSQGPVEPQQPEPGGPAHVERLVRCEKFVLDRWQFRSPQGAGGDDRCHIITILEGEVRVQDDPSESTLGIGQTVLLPASAGRVELAPEGETACLLLDAYLP